MESPYSSEADCITTVTSADWDAYNERYERLDQAAKRIRHHADVYYAEFLAEE